METLLKNKRPPIIPLLGAPGVKLSHTTLKENLTNPEIQYKTLSLLLEKFQPDGIFPMMDLSVEAEALGLKIDFPENAPPSVREHPIKNKETLDSLKRNFKPMAGRMPVFTAVVRKMKQNFPVLIGGYIIGPFTLAGELVGVEDFLKMLIIDPGLAKGILSFTTDFLTRYAGELFSAGADVIAILDPTSVTLSPKYYNEFSAPFIKEMVERLKKPLILHICGDTNHLLEAMAGTGAVGLSLDSMVDLREAADRMPNNIALIGNLDPVNVFWRATPEVVERRTRELVERMMGVNNFILSSGCDIPIEAPLENISAFMRAGRGGV
ncbi:MAG: uroporphyrinogen decarboxylase family protein [bacterium]